MIKKGFMDAKLPAIILPLADYCNIDGNHTMGFIQWRCDNSVWDKTITCRQLYVADMLNA